MSTRTVESPIRPLRIEVGGGRLRAIRFVDDDHDRVDDHVVSSDDETVLGRVADQLAEYFDGERRHFDLPLEAGGTTFQQQVWGHLGEVAYGLTSSYGRLASAMGKTGHGARAVGSANGRNPIPVVVPCHRVIGADGRLTGYAGGLARKQWLLAHERGERPAPLTTSD